MEDTNKLYDELAQNIGEAVTTDEAMTIIDDKELIEKVVDNATKKVNTYAYGDSGVVPGEDISEKLNENINIDKTSAINNMIQNVAIMKAQKEKEKEQKKLSAAELAERKKQVVEYMLYKQGEDFYAKNHCIMDGKTKRATRRRLERMFDKGKFKDFGITNLND